MDMRVTHLPATKNAQIIIHSKKTAEKYYLVGSPIDAEKELLKFIKGSYEKFLTITDEILVIFAELYYPLLAVLESRVAL